MTNFLTNPSQFYLLGLVVVAMLVALGSYAWWPKGQKGRGNRRDYSEGEENYMPNDGTKTKARPQSDQS